MNQIANRIAVVDGIPTTTTQDIADVYGKRHDNVLAIVRARMSEAGEWGVLNFKETPYTNPQNGQTYNVIRMTKKGFHFVVGKFTGAKAVQHQIAFADEFERMELALTGSQAPALPSTITPAQRQELHELVQLIVESGKQTWGETWKRFHNKFRVAKYEQLPSARFEEAKQYLKGKLDAESTIDLIGKHLNDRMPAAMELALAAASGVFTEALKHALAHEDPPSLIRLMASANYVPGQGMKAGVTPIGRDKCVMSFDDMTNAVNEPGGLRLSNTQLLGMLGAVTNKLTSRDTDQHRLAA